MAAQGSQVELVYVEETVKGTTPGSPSWLRIRKNSGGPVGEQGVIESGEIRSDRESASDVQGNNNVTGTINTELSTSSHDDFIRSAMSSDWTTTDTGVTTLDAVASTDTYDRLTGSFITDGFVVGQWALFEGFSDAANNGWKKIISVAALSLGVAAALVDESGGGDEQISAKYMKGGVTTVSFSVAKRFTDVNQEILFAGVEVDTWALTFAPEAIIGQTFTLNGLSESDPTVVGTAASDVATGDPMDSFGGQVLIDDVLNSNLTSFDFTIGNNMSDGFTIGSRDKSSAFHGRRSITGSVGFYFDNLTEYTASKNHTEKDLSISMSEGSNYYGLNFPRAYWSLPTPDGDEGPLIMSGDFRAKLDSVVGASVIISRSL